MGRSPACGSKAGAGGAVGVINKGPWTEAEDEILSAYIKAHGEGNWRLIPKLAGLSRCGKSCRLRWINYLRPDLKRGDFSPDEDNLILTLHALLGNRWSLIAGRIPGRTDNEIKNYWNTHLRRKLRSMGIDPLSYKVGLTLMPNSDEIEEAETVQFKRSKVYSSSSSHENTMIHGAQKVNESPLQSGQVSSPETSSSTSSASEFDSSSTSQCERILSYPAPPPGRSTSSAVGKPLNEVEQPCATSEASALHSQQPVLLGSLESFPSHSAPENSFSLAGSCGWEFDTGGMEHLQLLDHAGALNLEHFDYFSGILPLESHVQNDVQATLWTSPCLFDSLL